jgi:hypothetical protein
VRGQASRSIVYTGIPAAVFPKCKITCALLFAAIQPTEKSESRFNRWKLPIYEACRCRYGNASAIQALAQANAWVEEPAVAAQATRKSIFQTPPAGIDRHGRI